MQRSLASLNSMLEAVDDIPGYHQSLKLAAGSIKLQVPADASYPVNTHGLDLASNFLLFTSAT